MGTQRTWDLACERMAQRDRAMGDAQGGDENGRMGGERSPGRWQRGQRGRVKAWQSSTAQYRNVRPHTGKQESTHGEDRSQYDGPLNVARSLARTRRHRTLIDRATELLSERERDAKLGDVPAERLTRLAREIAQECDLLAGVTTGDVNRAVLIAQAVRQSI
jgi:hypothetical protein